jgi:hypothetical protein
MIPIREAVGRTIACPIVSGKSACGKPAAVGHSAGRVLPGPQDSEPIRTARTWYKVDCPRCGARLYRHNTPVEVIP